MAAIRDPEDETRLPVTGWSLLATAPGAVAGPTLLPAEGWMAASVPGTRPELLVLTTGAGSLILSHVNDGGFWLFKEYFNLSIKDTILTWSVMETIVSIMGLLGVLILNLFV